MQNDMLRKDIFQLTAYLLNVCITRLCTLGVSSGNAAGILYRHARDAHLDVVIASSGFMHFSFQTLNPKPLGA